MVNIATTLFIITLLYLAIGLWCVCVCTVMCVYTTVLYYFVYLHNCKVKINGLLVLPHPWWKFSNYLCTLKVIVPEPAWLEILIVSSELHDCAHM